MQFCSFVMYTWAVEQCKVLMSRGCAVCCSRVCSNRHGLIRKYGLNMCRQCFRQYAGDIGFKKVTCLLQLVVLPCYNNNIMCSTNTLTFHRWSHKGFTLHLTVLLRPVGEQSTAISLSVCVFVYLSMSISLEPLDRSSQTFVCRSPMAMAQSSSGGIAICFVMYFWLYGWCHIRP